MSKAEIRALIVEDSAPLRASLVRLFEGEGWEVAAVGSAREGLVRAASSDPDLVLTDLSLPDLTGLRLVRMLKLAPDPPVIVVVSSEDEPRVRVAVEAAGAAAFVSKMELAEVLLPTVRALFGAEPSDAPREPPSGDGDDELDDGPARPSGNGLPAVTGSR